MHFLKIISRYCAILSTVLLIGACTGGEDRKAEHLQRGKTLFEEQNYEKAQLEFKNVLQIDPEHVEARYLLARTSEQLAQWKLAATNYLRVTEADPTHVEARVRLSQLYLLGGNEDKAREFVEQALALAPENTEVMALRASLHAREGRWDAAIADARKVLAIDRMHVNARLLLASGLVQTGASGDAVRILEEGIAMHEGVTGLRSLLAKVHVSAGNTPRAVTVIEELVDREPEKLAHRLQLAGFYIGLDRLDDAEQVLRDGVQFDDADARAKRALAQFLASQGKHSDAIDSLKAFLEADPDLYTVRFELVKRYQAIDDAPSAMRELRSIIERAGSDSYGLLARKQLALLQARQKQFDSAAALTDEVLGFNPRDKEALVLRGSIAMARRDPNAAIVDFRTALRNDPESMLVLTKLAKAHRMAGELERSREYLRRAAAATWENDESALELAELLAAEQQQDAARRLLERTLEAEPGHMRTLEALARLQAADAAWDDARRTVERLQSIYPQSWRGHYLAGVIAQGQGEFQASIDPFNRALELEPMRIEPLSALVRSLLALQRAGEALAYLESLASESPSAAVQNLMGEVLHTEGRDQEARRALREAIVRRPQWALPYRNLAAVLLAEGDAQGAIKVYQEGLQATEGAPSLAFELAERYEALGEHERAIGQYEEMLRKHPDLAAASNNLAVLLVTYRDDAQSLDRALELVSKVDSSASPAYRDTLGWVHYKRGDIQRAVSVLEQVVEAAPAIPEFRYHLGMAYHLAGDLIGARVNLEQALASGAAFRGIEEARHTLAAMRGG